MKTALKIAAVGAAGATLFLGSYVGFAKVVGADMSKLLVVGGLFDPPPESSDSESRTRTKRARARSLRPSASSLRLGSVKRSV